MARVCSLAIFFDIWAHDLCRKSKSFRVRELSVECPVPAENIEI